MGGDQRPRVTLAAAHGVGGHDLLTELEQLGGRLELPAVAGAMDRAEDVVLQLPALADSGSGRRCGLPKVWVGHDHRRY